MMQKHCPECDAAIENKSKQFSRQTYCSAYCRKNAHRKKQRLMSRVERRRSNLRQNDEIIYVVKQCRRANTVQILKGHTLETFIETMSLIRNRPQGQIELCHIAPVKGAGSTGLLHSHNLFYGGAYQNRKNGKKYLSAGLKIENCELSEKWAVDSSMTTNDILLKIELYLGTVISEYIEVVAVRKSRKTSTINKILEVDKSTEFDHLITLRTRDLTYIWAKLSHTTARLPPTSRESKFIAYLNSISRFIGYNGRSRPELIALRRLMVYGYIALSKIKESQTYNKDFHETYGKKLSANSKRARLRDPKKWSEFKDHLYQIAFDALQGKKGDGHHYRSTIMPYLQFNARCQKSQNS